MTVMVKYAGCTVETSVDENIWQTLSLLSPQWPHLTLFPVFVPLQEVLINWHGMWLEELWAQHEELKCMNEDTCSYLFYAFMGLAFSTTCKVQWSIETLPAPCGLHWIVYNVSVSQNINEEINWIIHLSDFMIRKKLYCVFGFVS